MRAPRYIYLHSDTNEFFFSYDEPTSEDLGGAQVGTKVIVRVADHHFYGYEAKWLPIPEGAVVLTDTEDNQGQPFHVPPDYVTTGIPQKRD